MRVKNSNGIAFSLELMANCFWKQKIFDKTLENAQKAVLELKRKFGKNAVLKGMNLEEGGTTIERNRQVGGHKA